MTTSPPTASGRVCELVLQVSDLDRSVSFWSAALGQEPVRASDAPWVGFDVAPGVSLLLLPPAAWEQGASPVHLGILSDVPAELVLRLVEVGARPAPGAAGVVRDPDGLALVVHGA